MAKEREVRCDCGGIFRPQMTVLQGMKTEAMVCSKCKHTNLTKEQARKYAMLLQLHEIVDAERKIIKIGNSMGITLPDGLRARGVKIGKKVKTEALSPTSFKVELVD